jgi:hypothetical protein
MTNRNTIGLIVVIIMLFFDLLIYQYQKANSPKRLISCYTPDNESPQRHIADTFQLPKTKKP